MNREGEEESEKEIDRCLLRQAIIFNIISVSRLSYLLPFCSMPQSCRFAPRFELSP
jgi:hypothetical protein